MKRILLVAAACLLACGCSAQIGDECSSDSECPSGAWCDSTFPDGMCVSGPCRPGDCPEEAVCIRFKNGESYCMLSCSSNGDCRDGYDCILDLGPDGFCSVRD